MAMLCLVASPISASAQGLVNFLNTPSTLVTYNDGSGNGLSLINNQSGYFLFALLTSPVGANTFTFTGVYGTNQSIAGQFSGGVGVTVNGWAPGTARDFEVIGWNAAYAGVLFNPAWLTDPGSPGETIAWSFSGIGTGVAGGVTSSGTLPNLDIFDGANGIQQGFTIRIVNLVPEPSGLSLAVLGAVCLLIFRRRKAPNQPLAAKPATTIFCLAGCPPLGSTRHKDREGCSRLTPPRVGNP